MEKVKIYYEKNTPKVLFLKNKNSEEKMSIEFLYNEEEKFIEIDISEKNHNEILQGNAVIIDDKNKVVYECNEL